MDESLGWSWRRDQGLSETFTIGKNGTKVIGQISVPVNAGT